MPGKVPTGIAGFDEITAGGLPRGRTTLLEGSPGSGKTIFALQFLKHGAQYCKEPGIFVAFEEDASSIVANTDGFGWKLATLPQQKLFFLDAQPTPDLIQAGSFDLGGMLAVLGAQVAQMGARRIVFDALDIVLALLPDDATRRREVYRLHEWLLAQKLTGIITAKANGDEASTFDLQAFGFMHFMVDCAVILGHSVMLGVSQRHLRVQKYRGSSFDENESPFLIGKSGIEVAVARSISRADAVVSNERISSGVKLLDSMLEGGYYRGSTVLITGFAGTAKTTLSAAFAEAACGRGERTLFVSFDSDGSEVIRNLAAVNIRLERYVKSGVLRMISARTVIGSAGTHLVRIKALAEEHQARCLVIDPVSTLTKAGSELAAHSVAELLIDWSKVKGINLVCTSLNNEMTSQTEDNSQLNISTLADTWIHLSYVEQGGERNRGLSVVKSRGTAHSNQQRELILGKTGVTLADIYAFDGEVLMGTLRREKENTERNVREIAEVDANLWHVRLDVEEADLELRMKALQTELTAKQAEKRMLLHTMHKREQKLAKDLSQGLAQNRERRKRSRATDTTDAGRKRKGQ